MVYYMHTLDGYPATYDGEQICFITLNNGQSHNWALLCKSLYQIKKEQKASKRWREEQGFDNNSSEGWLKIAS